MNATAELGKSGEELAATLLEKKGYRILERNWRWGKNEIDIIARDGPFLVIVEVKTRTGSDYSDPGTMVPKQKQRTLVRAANAFVRYRNHLGEVRFDVVVVVAKKEGEEVTHIPDAFYATL
jgi:putative endonuclease